MTSASSIHSASSAATRFTGVAALFAITACGGGGGGAAPPPPPLPPPDPTVSAMAINPVAFNARDLIVTIEGTDLEQGLTVSSAQCTTLTRSNAAPNASGASSAYYRCAATPAATTVTVDATRSKDNTALLSASFEIGAPTTVVTALAGDGATPPEGSSLGIPGIGKYGQQITVTVTGTNVNQGLLFPATPACTGLTLSTTPPLVSSASTAYYRCRVAALNLNHVVVELASAPGLEAVTPARFDVPLPEVTLNMASVDPANASRTPLGQIVITMTPDLAPISSNNFLDYVNSGFYNGTIFHSVQALPAPPLLDAGRYGPTTGSPLPAQKAVSAANPPEVGSASSFVKWSVAMTLNTAPSNGPARFFINMADNNLGGASAVFGSVTSGQTLANSMAASCSGQAQCLPIPNFTIDSAVQTR